MSTPALARATEAAKERVRALVEPIALAVAKKSSSEYPTRLVEPDGETPTNGARMLASFALDVVWRELGSDVIVSAALHDPDDPDWLEKVIRNVRLSLVGRDPFEVDRLTAVAVRAAILGEAS